VKLKRPTFEEEVLSDAEKAARLLSSLRIPEGPRAGRRLRLAPFQRAFVEGALAPGCDLAVLSVGRGNAKSALSAGLALGALLGVFDQQPRRDVIIAARTRDQARVAWNFAAAFTRSLPDATQRQLIFRRSPRLEIEYTGDGGEHVIRAIAADGKSALGSGPTLVVMDERGHWERDSGDELEQALLTGLGKRAGRALLISTSASDDAHPFSKWIDQPPAGAYVQEHRPAPGLPADELESLSLANPGAAHGVGASLEWLSASARRATARGGSALAGFRLYHRNERVSGETRDLLLTLDQWLAAETATLPPRSGPVIVGLDLGGSASMSAAALFWFELDRLEVYGTFPGYPSLLDRGQADGVGSRYVTMQERGELATLGAKTVPVAEWISETMRRIEGQPVAAIVADRFKQAEISEALQRAGVTAPVIWRGMGFRDGGEDCERFRRAVFDQKVKCAQSLLMRSALADTVCLRDPANNIKLAKARSTGRIDAAAAAVLAVAEGARRTARSAPKPGRMIWA
jgi:phage terminase large subunit-like protein